MLKDFRAKLLMFLAQQGIHVPLENITSTEENRVIVFLGQLPFVTMEKLSRWAGIKEMYISVCSHHVQPYVFRVEFVLDPPYLRGLKNV